jgi:hypothetical protein
MGLGQGHLGVLGKAGTSRQPTYYFSAAGSDANDGKTLATPKQTITAFNALTLVATDYVVFRGGDTFAGAIVVGQSGSALSSIVLGSYGVGQATIAPAAASSAIAATNQSYITIQNLTCTGADTTAAAGAAGINFQTSSGTSTNNIVQNCTVSGFGDNGILFNVSSTGHTSGCQVLNCIAFGNTIGTNSFTAGIQFTGNGNSGTTYWPHVNGLIDRCVAHDNTGKNGTVNWCGTGIKVGSCIHTYITNCVAYNNGALCNLPSGGATGIWMSQCSDTWIKFCESYSNSSVNADGCGFDMDGGSQNSGCMFNYSHDNTGAGFMDFTFTGQAGDNINNTIAFNLSVNDCTTNHGAIVVSGSSANLTGSKVFNNTIFCKSTVVGTSAMWVMKGGGTLSATIANNIIVSESANCKLINTNASNPGAGVTFAGNCYYALSTFAIEWNGTTYSTGPLWQTATSQEKISGSNVAFFAIEPLTYLLGAKGIIGDSSMGRLTVASPLYNTGVNIFSNFSIDPSVQGARDLYGGAVSSAGPYSVGCSWAGSAVTTILFSTPGDFTQTVPADFASLLSVETISGGGGNGAAAGGTGGGGAYAKITGTSTALVAGVTQISGHVGAAGAGSTGSAPTDGEASWWNATSLANAVALGSAISCAAEGGKSSTTTASASGGLAANSVGTTKFSGGTGGARSGAGVGGGGGGAAGPFGAGATGGAGGGTAGFGAGGGGGADGGSTPATAGSSTGANGGNGPTGLGGAAGVGTQNPGAAGTREGGGAGSVGSGGSQPGGSGGPGIVWGGGTGPGAGSGGGVGVTLQSIVGGNFGGGAGARNGGPGGQGAVRFAYKTAGVV